MSGDKDMLDNLMDSGLDSNDRSRGEISTERLKDMLSEILSVDEKNPTEFLKLMNPEKYEKNMKTGYKIAARRFKALGFLIKNITKDPAMSDLFDEYAKSKDKFRGTDKSMQNLMKTFSHTISAIGSNPKYLTQLNYSIDRIMRGWSDQISEKIETINSKYIPRLVVGTGSHATMFSGEALVLDPDLQKRTLYLDSNHHFGGQFRSAKGNFHLLNTFNNPSTPQEYIDRNDGVNLNSLGNHVVTETPHLSNRAIPTNREHGTAQVLDLFFSINGVKEMKVFDVEKNTEETPGEYVVYMKNTTNNKIQKIYTDQLVISSGLGMPRIPFNAEDVESINIVKKEKQKIKKHFEDENNEIGTYFELNDFQARRTLQPRESSKILGNKTVTVVGGSDSSDVVIKDLNGMGFTQSDLSVQLHSFPKVINLGTNFTTKAERRGPGKRRDIYNDLNEIMIDNPNNELNEDMLQNGKFVGVRGRSHQIRKNNENGRRIITYLDKSTGEKKSFETDYIVNTSGFVSQDKDILGNVHAYREKVPDDIKLGNNVAVKEKYENENYIKHLPDILSKDLSSGVIFRFSSDHGYLDLKKIKTRGGDIKYQVNDQGYTYVIDMPEDTTDFTISLLKEHISKGIGTSIANCFVDQVIHSGKKHYEFDVGTEFHGGIKDIESKIDFSRLNFEGTKVNFEHEGAMLANVEIGKKVVDSRFGFNVGKRKILITVDGSNSKKESEIELDESLGTTFFLGELRREVGNYLKKEVNSLITLNEIMVSSIELSGNTSEVYIDDTGSAVTRSYDNRAGAKSINTIGTAGGLPVIGEEANHPIYGKLAPTTASMPRYHNKTMATLQALSKISKHVDALQNNELDVNPKIIKDVVEINDNILNQGSEPFHIVQNVSIEHNRDLPLSEPELTAKSIMTELISHYRLMSNLWDSITMRIKRIKKGRGFEVYSNDLDGSNRGFMKCMTRMFSDPDLTVLIDMMFGNRDKKKNEIELTFDIDKYSGIIDAPGCIMRRV